MSDKCGAGGLAFREWGGGGGASRGAGRRPKAMAVATIAWWRGKLGGQTNGSWRRKIEFLSRFL